MSDFKPWTKYPDLTEERLSILANIIRRVRSETIALHDPMGGDNEWSLACRSYSRTCHSIREATKSYRWLKELPEKESLRFSFGIGDIPFRFYRGKPDDPPEHYAIRTYGELRHIQSVLQFDGQRPPLDKVLRLAVEIDEAREVSCVIFVEMDEAGNTTKTYIIPFGAAPGVVTPFEIKPVVLPPAVPEPLPTKEEEKKKGQGKQEHKRK